MKKHIFYSLLVGSALTFSACDEDFNDVAAPQVWPQEEAVSIPGFSASALAAVDLAGAADSVAVFSAQVPADLPEGTTIANYRLTLTPSVTDGAASTILQASADGKVATADLQAVIESNFGKRPQERSFDAVLAADLMKGGQATLLTAGAFVIKATPKAPQISNHYYLIGAPSAWSPTEVSMPFSHSGKDVYEDPIFTIVFSVDKKDANNELWFAVADDQTVDSNDWSLVFGCTDGNGNNAMEGKLDRRANLADDGSWKIVVDEDIKLVKMTLNMMDYTYKLETFKHPEYIYEVGANTLWNNALALQNPNLDGEYHGALYLTDSFLLRQSIDAWNGVWGVDEDGKLVQDGDNIMVPGDGFYKIEVNLEKKTYMLTPFAQMGIIGDGQPGGWETDTPMTYDEQERCWVATGVELTADKFIKFRSLGSWDIVNLGGAMHQLIFNSQDNIPVTESGIFTVKLYLETTGKYYATLTK